MDKETFRKEMRKMLKGMDPVAKAFESVGKCMSFVQSDVFRNADVVMGFMPLKSEPDVLPLLRTAMSGGKKVLLPRISDDFADMDFYAVREDPIAATEKNHFGIYEPKKTLERADVFSTDAFSGCGKVLVLIPGLGFGKDGSRIGRGRGYYDRFLSELVRIHGKEKFVFAGVCYGIQVFESVPHDENDVSVDFLI